MFSSFHSLIHKEADRGSRRKYSKVELFREVVKKRNGVRDAVFAGFKVTIFTLQKMMIFHHNSNSQSSFSCLLDLLTFLISMIIYHLKSVEKFLIFHIFNLPHSISRAVPLRSVSVSIFCLWHRKVDESIVSYIFESKKNVSERDSRAKRCGIGLGWGFSSITM